MRSLSKSELLVLSELDSIKVEVINKPMRKKAYKKTGKELMNILGLDTNKKTTTITVKPKTSVDLYIESINAKYSKKYNVDYIEEDFNVKKIGDIYGFTHKNWKNTYCYGGKTRKDAKDCVKRYCSTNGKNVEWVHLIPA